MVSQAFLSIGHSTAERTGLQPDLAVTDGIVDTGVGPDI